VKFSGTTGGVSSEIGVGVQPVSGDEIEYVDGQQFCGATMPA